MLRPEAFQQPHVTLENLPYFVADESERIDSLPTGGVLGRGHMVWTQEAYALHTCPHSTLAFVEELGVVSLDPRWLIRTEAPLSAPSTFDVEH